MFQSFKLSLNRVSKHSGRLYAFNCARPQVFRSTTAESSCATGLMNTKFPKRCLKTGYRPFLIAYLESNFFKTFFVQKSTHSYLTENSRRPGTLRRLYSLFDRTLQIMFVKLVKISWTSQTNNCSFLPSRLNRQLGHSVWTEFVFFEKRSADALRCCGWNLHVGGVEVVGNRRFFIRWSSRFVKKNGFQGRRFDNRKERFKSKNVF